MKESFPDEVAAMADAIDPTDGSSVGVQLLVDRYRCNKDVATFLLEGGLRAKSGYFRFGEGVVCYGRCSSVETRNSPTDTLQDALGEVSVEGTRVLLPFDPEQVIDNLRAERYRGKANRLKSFPGSRAVGSVYYFLRPLMPVFLRKHLQKFYFSGWKDIQFPKWPLDTTVEDIHERLLLLALKARGGKPIPFIWFWPNGAQSCTVVTHDVETKLGVELCSQLMDLNDSFSIKSSFQIVPEERYIVSHSFLDEIRARGFEVNVHDLNHDGHLFRDEAEFLRRAELINRYIRQFGADGFRSAIMYRNVDWYHALNVNYDMSVPNVSHLDPQQGGCCTVLPFFIGNIVELPVTMTQDYSLFHILDQYSTELWIEQSRRVREKHGILNVIVHPDYLDDQKARQVYSDLLAHFSELRLNGQTWITLAREAAIWWRQRSKLRLVAEGDSWKIEGNGCERATLAYATLDGDSVRYDLVR